MPLGAWYHATKHALEGWSDCLRFETAQFGIKVIIIEPGVIDTDFGKVLLDPLLSRSGNGVYSAMARKFAKMTEATYIQPGGTSPVSVISTIISRAIKARRPKTRYVAGRMAKLMICLRQLLGDRGFDRLFRMMLR